MRWLFPILVAAGLSPWTPGKCSAQPFTQVPVRGPNDWHITVPEGDEASVDIIQWPPGNRAPRALWRLKASAPSVNSESAVQFYLQFSDFGIDPVPIAKMEFIRWEWRVFNMETSGSVALRLVLEDGLGTISLGASHQYFDHPMLYFKPPERLRDESITLTEVWDLLDDTDVRPPPDSLRVSGLEIAANYPYKQIIHFGNLSFSEARKEPLPRPARQAHLASAEGQDLVVDLDRDGTVEVITPWLAGPKLWRYDRQLAEFRRVPTQDFLSTPEDLFKVCAADLDQDGDEDLVAMTRAMNQIYIVKNTLGGFQATLMDVPLPNSKSSVYSLCLADDNQDGYPELFLSHVNTLDLNPIIQRLQGFPGCRFGPPETLRFEGDLPPDFFQAYRVSVVDFNNDGFLDVAATSPNRIGVNVFPGRGDGTYGTPFQAAAFLNSGLLRDVDYVDFTGDGFLDIYASIIKEGTDPSISGYNFAYVSHTGTQFSNATEPLNLFGSTQTEASIFANLDANPGLELLMLEDRNIVIVSGGPGFRNPPPESRTIYSSQEDIGSGQFYITDFEDDGDLEMIISLPEGPKIRRWRPPVPMSRVVIDRYGPDSNLNHEVIQIGSDVGRWSFPITRTSSVSVPGFTTAAGDSMLILSLDRADTLWAGMLQPGLNKVSLGSAWDRIKYRRRLTVEAVLVAGASPWGRGIALVLATFLIAWQGIVYYRRRNTPHTEVSWRILLESVGFASHNAQWYPPIKSLGKDLARLLKESPTQEHVPKAYLAQARSRLPKEILESLARGLREGQRLELPDLKRPMNAVDALMRLHLSSAPKAQPLYEATEDLLTSLPAVKLTLARKFSCDVEALLADYAKHFKTRSGTERCTFTWAVKDPDARRFPTRATDLFMVLDEFVENALKKRPVPTQICVTILVDYRDRVLLQVWDNGLPLATTDYDDRPGSRSGLNQLRALMAPYRGRVTLTNHPDGGVVSELSVHAPDSRSVTGASA